MLPIISKCKELPPKYKYTSLKTKRFDFSSLRRRVVEPNAQGCAFARPIFRPEVNKMMAFCTQNLASVIKCAPISEQVPQPVSRLLWSQSYLSSFSWVVPSKLFTQNYHNTNLAFHASLYHGKQFILRIHLTIDFHAHTALTWQRTWNSIIPF